MQADDLTPAEGGSNYRTPVLIAGCLVAVCGLIACLACIALLLVPRLQGSLVAFPQPTGVQTPTPTQSSGTPTAGPTRAATPVPTVKVGNETLSVKQVILSEDFATNTRNWRTDRLEGLYMYVEDGRYYVEVRANNTGQGSYVTASQTPVTTDFILQVNARAELGPSRNVYGLAYGDSKIGEYYQLAVSDIKEYRIRHGTVDRDGNTDWQVVVPWQTAQPPKPQTEWHTLTVVKRGTTVTFYQNGQVLDRFEDAHETGPTRIGVYTGAWEEPVGIGFDNLYFATLNR